jgi:threonine dehydrogenase-like Zn-dependent dehydrogenase
VSTWHRGDRHPTGLDTATELVPSTGRLILGFHQGGRRSVDRDLELKSIGVINAHVRREGLLNEAIRRGLELTRRGSIRPGRLLTHRFPLEDLDGAFEALASKPEGFIKEIVANEEV